MFWLDSFFHISLGCTRGKNLTEKKSRRNNFKYTLVDSVFCADSKYDICLGSNGGYFVRKPTNISQKGPKLGLKGSIWGKSDTPDIEFQVVNGLIGKSTLNYISDKKISLVHLYWLSLHRAKRVIFSIKHQNLKVYKPKWPTRHRIFSWKWFH